MVLDLILSEEINLVLHLLHIHEVGANVVIAQLDRHILHFPLLGLVINDQLGIDDLKCHHEEGQYKCDMLPRAFICVDEMFLLGIEVVTACPGDIILQYEVEGSNELSEVDLVSINEAKVYVIFRVNDVNIHVIQLGEGGRFSAHKPSGEGTELI